MRYIAAKTKLFLVENKVLLLKIVFLFLLFIFIMPPNYWQPNEENYLGMAWRRFSPDSLAKISALNDAVNHRFLFDYLTGASITVIGFEWTHALGRILVALLYAISLTCLFKTFKFTLINSLTIILTFVWLGEDILGGDWLFRGFEAKTIAYPFVFFSFSSFIQKKHTLSYLLLAIATYFHFLVGAFWFLVTLISQYYKEKNLKTTTVHSLNYIVTCAPLFLLIAVQQLSDPNPENSELSASWIYSHLRTPHHVAPFASAKLFTENWYQGIVFLFGLTVISVIIYNCANKNEKNPAKLILGLNIYLIVSLIISAFDKNGSLGKFYLFRPSSVILFLSLCFFGLFIKNRLANNFKQISCIALVLISCLSIPTLQGHDLLYKRIQSVVIQEAPFYSVLFSFKDFLPVIDIFPNPENNERDVSDLERIIRAGQESDIFLIEPKLEDKYINFERKYNRPTLVSRRFVPSTSHGILRWFHLFKSKRQLFEVGCPAEILQDYTISYLIGDISNEAINNCGKTIYKEKNIKIIKLNQE